MELNLVTVKEFEPDLAGETIAWLDVMRIRNKRTDGPDAVDIQLSVAKVGANGGKYYFEERNDEHLFWSNHQYGLLGLTAMEFYTFPESESEQMRELIHGGLLQKSDQTDAFSHIGFLPEVGSPSTGGQWFVGKPQIIEGIKTAFAETGLSDEEYARFYYQMNYSLCARREDYSPNSPLTPHPLFLAEYAITDPAMWSRTIDEQSHVQRYASLLESIIGEDQHMLTTLRRARESGSVSNTVEQFVESRRQQSVLASAARLAVQGALIAEYIPNGEPRPFARSWPYMDYDCGDERGAFGLEQNDLAAGSAERAIHELEAEIRDDKQLKLPHLKGINGILAHMLLEEGLERHKG